MVSLRLPTLATLPALAALLGLAACAYDPPLRADHAAPAYRADLKACRASGGREANLVVSRRFPIWVAYPFTYPPEARRQIRACMAAKGYKPAG